MFSVELMQKLGLRPDALPEEVFDAMLARMAELEENSLAFATNALQLAQLVERIASIVRNGADS